MIASCPNSNHHRLEVQIDSDGLEFDYKTSRDDQAIFCWSIQKPRNAPAKAPTQRLAAIAPGICMEANPSVTPTVQITNSIKTKKWSTSRLRLPKPSQHFTRSSSMWAATQIGKRAGSRKAPQTDPINIERVKHALSAACVELIRR